LADRKIRVAVLFGGRSCEHEVSVASALSLVRAIPRERYEVRLIRISREGRWFTAADPDRLLAAEAPLASELIPVLLDYAHGRGLLLGAEPGCGWARSQQIDVVFPLLHGPYGEDGTVQGLLELMDVAYVGSGVVGSAIGMDKEQSRRVFRAAGLPQVEYLVVRRERWEREREAVLGEIESRFALPLFVKPVSLGSSVGVSRVAAAGELAAAIDAAAQFDYKVMVEAAALGCREVEVAILGNEAAAASVPGEIVPAGAFYDYDAKYRDSSSQLIIPARLSASATARVRELALRAFRAVEGAGLARVDFFVGQDDERIYVSEINTIPGFTPISMYPKLWEASGIDYPRLIERLIDLALERQRDKRRTRTAL